jgi:hypothetical protein
VTAQLAHILAVAATVSIGQETLSVRIPVPVNGVHVRGTGVVLPERTVAGAAAVTISCPDALKPVATTDQAPGTRFDTLRVLPGVSPATENVLPDGPVPAIS